MTDTMPMNETSPDEGLRVSDCPDWLYLLREFDTLYRHGSAGRQSPDPQPPQTGARHALADHRRQSRLTPRQPQPKAGDGASVRGRSTWASAARWQGMARALSRVARAS